MLEQVDGIHVDPPMHRIVRKEFTDMFLAEAERNIRPETQVVVFLMSNQKKDMKQYEAALLLNDANTLSSGYLQVIRSFSIHS